MIKRNLFSARRGLAIILAATLVMSYGVTALADGVAGADAKVEADTGKGNDNDQSTQSDNDTDVTKTADTAKSSDSESAVTAKSSDGKKAEVNIKDDVTTDSHNESGSGISSSSMGEGSSTSVTVGGDVSVEVNLKDQDTESSSAIDASAEDHSSVDISVGGNVTSTTHGNGEARAIDAYAGGDSITNIKVDGNVVADSKVEGESNYGSSIGIFTSPSDGDVSIKVGGDVTSNSAGGFSQTINVNPVSTGSGDEHHVSINVDGDVIATTADGTAQAINVFPNQNGGGSHTPSISIDVGQDVIATSTGESGGAYGIVGRELGDADVSIEVGGNIAATGGWAEAILLEGTEGTFQIEVVGDVTQNGEEDGCAIALQDGSETANIGVTVGGDVIASNTAVNLFKSSDDSTIDLVVKGTIKGDEHSIVLNQVYDENYTASPSKTENLNITVWKVDTSKNNNIVENSTYDGSSGKKSYTQNTAVEKNINYIIQIDGDNLGVDKAKDSNGLYTAKQDEKVFLKLDVPSGYAVDSFYNAKDAANVEVLQDTSGNYYLVVPRGGGVFVGVNLKQTATTPSGETNDLSGNTSSESSSGGSGSSGSSGGSSSSSGGSSGGSSSSSGGSSGGSSDSSDSSVSNTPTGSEASSQTFNQRFTDVVASLAAVGIDATSFFQIRSVDALGNELSLDINNVLKPVDTLTAINNFMSSNTATLGIDNVKGAGIVSLSNYFIGSAADTVNVPVVSDVVSGQTYTVVFSDGTTIAVPCTFNGVLNIPFSKTADGLTFIIYGVSMNPALTMQQMMQQPTA